MFSLFDIERRMLPEFCMERDIRNIHEKDPHMFWKVLFRTIQLSGGICKCGRFGTIRRIAGLAELISSCQQCQSFWILRAGIEVPYTFAEEYAEEPLSSIDGWKCIRPMNVFVACGTAKLLTDDEVEEWLHGLLKNAVGDPYHRAKLIDAIIETENTNA